MSEFAIIKDKIIGLASMVNEIIPGRLELEFIEPRIVEAVLKLTDTGFSLTMIGRFELNVMSGDSRSMETMQPLYLYKGCYIIRDLIDYPIPSLGGSPSYILVPIFYTEKVIHAKQ